MKAWEVWSGGQLRATFPPIQALPNSNHEKWDPPDPVTSEHAATITGQDH